MVVLCAIYVCGARLCAPGNTLAMTDVDQRDIDALKQELLRTSNPDSIRWRLAVVYSRSGDLDGRNVARQLFDRLREVYDSNPLFHLDVADLHVEGRHFHAAKEELHQAIAVDSTQVVARVKLAKLEIEETLRYLDFSEMAALVSLLEEARAYAPEDRATLFHLSLACQLARRTPGLDAIQMSLRGKDAIERLLKVASRDGDAHLLLGVHLTDLKEWEAAEQAFQKAIQFIPYGEQSDFLTLGYVGNEAQIDRFHHLDSRDRLDFVRDYWEASDPTPLTLVNESRLEYWKRLALAKFYFSDERRGLIGWKTEPGEVFVRYGMPLDNSYEQGGFGNAQINTSADPGIGRKPNEQTLDFIAPKWDWMYQFGGQAFHITFEDPSLQGQFRTDDRSKIALGALQSEAPAILSSRLPGEITNFFVSTTGVRGEEGKTTQTLLAGIGRFGPRAREWWKSGVIHLSIVDAGSRAVAQLERKLASEDIFEPLDDTELAVISQEIALQPGRYTIEASIQDSRTGDEGSWSAPLYVHEYRRDRLQMSELEFALVADAGQASQEKLGRPYVPNPMRVAGDNRRLNVYFEIYNLTPDAGGTVRFQTRYTVLPRQYVLGYLEEQKKSRSAKTAVPDSLRFGRVGTRMGRATLSSENYLDVLYPLETGKLRAGGRVRKNGQVDLAGLRPGEYAILVTVTDRESRETVTSQVDFQLTSDEQLRAILEGE